MRRFSQDSGATPVRGEENRRSRLRSSAKSPISWPVATVLMGIFLLAAACRPASRTTVGESPVTFLSGGGSEGFERVLEPRLFDLPLDHGAHEAFQIEWWYLTGNLADPQQRRFGFELTFFRIGLEGKEGKASEGLSGRNSRWATDQLYMAHFAVTDVRAREFHAFERLTRGGLDLAGVRAFPLRVWNESWSLEAHPPVGASDPFPLKLVAGDRDGEMGEVSIELELMPKKPLVLQGDRGFSRKGPEPGNASYYLQYPRLEAIGNLTLGESRFEVSGLAWMDHEWSTSVLGAELVGWDWFALQLDDGRDLMVYQLRGRDGKATAASQGTIIDSDGKVVRLSSQDFDLRVTDHWRSSYSAATYPSGWRLRIPSQLIDLAITPVIEDQELRLSTTYWEGAVVVESTAQDLLGRGYVELVGYVAKE